MEGSCCILWCAIQPADYPHLISSILQFYQRIPLGANHLQTRVRQLSDSSPQSLAEGRGWLMATLEANHPTWQVGDWQVHWQIDRSSCQVVQSHVKYNMMYVCSFYFPTWPSPWMNRWAPCHHLLNYYINWLPSMGPYSMSYMHLGSFSLTHLEQHFMQWTGICKLDLFCAWDHLTCHAMGHPLHKGQCLLD